MHCINNMNGIASGLIIASCVFYSCTSRTGEISPVHEQQTDSLSQDTIVQPEVKPVNKKLTAEQIEISKDLLYDQYTLEDTYPYKDTTRQFQWDKIKEQLALLENIQLQPSTWAILQNYKNRNGEAPLVRSFKRNAYGRVADTLGIERYQSVPLYLLTDTLVPERYGQDGELTRFIEDGEKFIKAEPMFTGDEWMIPKKYVKVIGDTIVFNKAVFVDRHNQNIASLERSGKGQWVVRSMNPSTTGRHLPPYAQETPLGMFVLQEKKVTKVYYPGIEGTKAYEICKKQASGFGSMLTFEVESKELALHILKSTKLIPFAESLGGVETLLTYPTTQTHADVPEEVRIRNGIIDRVLRLSVGIEDKADLIADLKQAIDSYGICNIYPKGRI
jgi:hypothetical protein